MVTCAKLSEILAYAKMSPSLASGHQNAAHPLKTQSDKPDLRSSGGHRIEPAPNENRQLDAADGGANSQLRHARERSVRLHNTATSLTEFCTKQLLI